jgi:Helix-turn-helix domain
MTSNKAKAHPLIGLVTEVQQALDRKSALHAIRDSLPGTTCEVQRQRLLAAIQKLGSITTFEAMRHLDIFDPRPRKLELLQAGHPIQLAWDRLETEAGVVHRVGRYYMAHEMAKGVTA